MTQLILNVADNQVNFFLELLRRFDFVKLADESEAIEISEEQKSILDKRLENFHHHPDSYLDLEEVIGNFRKRYETSELFQ